RRSAGVFRAAHRRCTGRLGRLRQADVGRDVQVEESRTGRAALAAHRRCAEGCTVSDEREQRELLATSCHILYKLGLSDYLGHPSVRLDADRVLIKPKHSPRVHGMDTMRAADMVVIDLSGRLVDGEHEPPSERFIHTEIYR